MAALASLSRSSRPSSVSASSWSEVRVTPRPRCAARDSLRSKWMMVSAELRGAFIARRPDWKYRGSESQPRGGQTGRAVPLASPDRLRLSAAGLSSRSQWLEQRDARQAGGDGARAVCTGVADEQRQGSGGRSTSDHAVLASARPPEHRPVLKGVRYRDWRQPIARLAFGLNSAISSSRSMISWT